MAASRKTYVLIAERVKQAKPQDESKLEVYKRAIEAVADALWQDNPAFSTGTFIEACGLE